MDDSFNRVVAEPHTIGEEFINDAGADMPAGQVIVSYTTQQLYLLNFPKVKDKWELRMY